MNKPYNPTVDEQKARMSEILTRQRAAQLRAGPPSMQQRKDRLTRAINLIVVHEAELLDAVNADFGARSRDMTRFVDVSVAIGAMKYARKHMDKWMRGQRRKVEPGLLGMMGARAEVRYQPKGVIGVMTPWNFPINLPFDAIASAFAAGNRVMWKPSEFTPQTSALLARLIDLFFDEEEIAVINGGPEIGAAFAGLPFDHLIFTGSTATGRRVMQAAAANLTPVTLELGGKSPVLVGRSADLTKTAARVMTGKLLNAGQVCLAPDYAMVPRENLDAFADKAVKAVSAMYPTIKDNPDYSAIINQRHFERVKGLVADARAKGARVIEVNPAKEDFTQQEHRRIPPTLILGATNDMAVMQEEIFGPVLPILTYDSFDETITRVNAGERPLALYYFGEDAGETEAALTRTHSGGVTLNDVIFHFSMDDLPFGGVGASGIGAYHGHRGFVEFSHEKGVYKQIASEALAVLRPPYGATFKKYVASKVKA